MNCFSRIAMLVGILAACVARAADAPANLRVMSFNVLRGGEYMPLARTASVIEAAGADIVGIQEAWESPETLAKVLAFHLHIQSRDMAILSRYPIIEKYKYGVKIQLPNRQEAGVFNVHMPAYPYQPYDIRDKKLADEDDALIAASKTRSAEMARVLAEIKPFVDAKKPVFLLGDFNEPSHLDWTEKAKELHFGWKVAWPVSQLVMGVGLRDAYRQMNADELARPGYTWTPLVTPKEKHDRIDFVYFGGEGVKVESAAVLGEKKELADIVVSPYPSDHRAVVGAFTIPKGPIWGVNLIENGGAELPLTGAVDGELNWAIPAWETEEKNTPVTAQKWNGFSADHDGGAGVLSRPANAGQNYFYGGRLPNLPSRISQVIDLSEATNEIETGWIDFELSGWFGGWHNKDDHAELTALFLGADGRTLGGASAGGGTVASRAGKPGTSAGPSGMKADSIKARLPAGTRKVRVELNLVWAGRGNTNDASADNLSFIINKPQAATRPSTQPKPN